MNGFIYGYTEDGAPITDVWEFERLLRDIDARRVDHTDLAVVQVFTTNLLTDHNFTDPGRPPITFETWVEALPHCPAQVAQDWNNATFRYPNRVAAQAGHDQIVAEIKAAIAQYTAANKEG